MQQCRTLCPDHAVVAVIRTAQGPKNIVDIADSAQAPEGIERRFMRLQCIGKGHAVMALTYWPNAARRPCFWQRFRGSQRQISA